jgi:sugar transferase EpsL|tara:strand:- start:1938 stop:2534 length:597 start_codon:yes stop_codon:yes gene_type:complete
MYNISKSFFDITLSLILLVIFSPIIIFISFIILAIDGWPIFFFQKRGGFNQKAFYIIKFRTMIAGDMNKLSLNDDKKRTTRFGLFLRKYSLDELPSLINVLKRDMSFVGPRPLLYEYKSLYNKEQKLRFTVKPGITGWSQINGRNNLTWEEKFNLDLWYIKNANTVLDIKIILKTIIKVFQNKDVNFDGFDKDFKFRG